MPAPRDDRADTAGREAAGREAAGREAAGREAGPPTGAVTPRLLRRWPLPRPGGDKHARGSVLVVGGAARSPGAAMLAGLAALRAGAGRLQLAVAAPAAPALAIAVPEALVVPLPHDAASGSIEPAAADEVESLLAACDAVCIGPGLDDPRRTGALVPRLLAAVPGNAGVVLDAYALGALAEDAGLLADVKARAVLTPNVGEAGLLLRGEPPDGDHLGEAAVHLAGEYSAVVSLFGHVAAPDGTRWDEGAGPAGLGTSGSGDVLAGIVAGLLARGADAAQAAVWGTHLHAASGERLAARIGPTGFLARELLDEVPAVLAELVV